MLGPVLSCSSVCNDVQMKLQRTLTRLKQAVVTLCSFEIYPQTRLKMRCVQCAIMSYPCRTVMHTILTFLSQICRHFSNLYALNKPDWSFSGYFGGCISRKRSRLPHTNFHRFIRHDANLQGSKYPLPVRKFFGTLFQSTEFDAVFWVNIAFPFMAPAQY